MGARPKTLNIGSGLDIWGDVRLDKHPQYPGVIKFDFNKESVLPYKENSFSQIRLNNIIQFALRPQKLLEECYRVLRPGGILNISTINSSSLRFYISPLGKKYSKGRANWGFEHVHSLYTIYTLKDALELAGFKISRMGYGSNMKPFKDLIVFVAYKS
jgi:ubiquinone/menaquinone biosynthesis C-methylase UbiE